MQIDLNCDAGEFSSGSETVWDSDSLIPFSSVNIACGLHAGDPSTMRQVVVAAKRLGIAIGAHPGLPDRAGFGRRHMAVTPGEVRVLLLYQLGALAAIVQSEQATLRHVKPHGALYHLVCAEDCFARSLAEAVAGFDVSLKVLGLPNSALSVASHAAGLVFVPEAFADRLYRADGTLVSRDESDALITNSEQAVAQALEMALRKRLLTRAGTWVAIHAETICLHGDNSNSIAVALAVRSALDAHGLHVSAE